MHCCGVAGPIDWKLLFNITKIEEYPASCQMEPDSYPLGCGHKLGDIASFGALMVICGTGTIIIIGVNKY